MKITGKMERWIETRLWKQRVQNETVAVAQLVSELEAFFKLTLSQATQKLLEAEIRKIRFRIYKRHQRFRAYQTAWALQFGVPEQMIRRWSAAGWLDPGKPEILTAVSGILFERDYYYRFIEPLNAEHKIPADPKVSLAGL